jgi:hypothetical protein
MFSINKLINDLDQNQENIADDINDSIQKYDSSTNKTMYEEYIVESNTKMKKLSSDIGDKYCNIKDFYYDNIKWNKNTFIYSILRILDGNFDFILNKRKNEIIDSIRKKMCYDLVEKNYYSKFGYTRKRKFKREKLQKYLMDSSTDIDLEKYSSVRKYIVDYFNINVFIISDTSVECIYTERENVGYFKHRPTVFLYYNDKYYPLVKNVICDDNLYLDYNNNKDIIDELLETSENTIIYYDGKDDSDTVKDDSDTVKDDSDGAKDDSDGVKDDSDGAKDDSGGDKKIELICNKKSINLNKLKLSELHNMCTLYKIDITKSSTVTNKVVKKKKTELVEELNKVVK